MAAQTPAMPSTSARAVCSQARMIQSRVPKNGIRARRLAWKSVPGCFLSLKGSTIVAEGKRSAALDKRSPSDSFDSEGVVEASAPPGVKSPVGVIAEYTRGKKEKYEFMRLHDRHVAPANRYGLAGASQESESPIDFTFTPTRFDTNRAGGRRPTRARGHSRTDRDDRTHGTPCRRNR